VVQESVLLLADIQALSLHTTQYSLVVLVESMAHIQDSPSEVSSKVDNNKEDSNNNKEQVRQINNKRVIYLRI